MKMLTNNVFESNVILIPEIIPYFQFIKGLLNTHPLTCMFCCYSNNLLFLMKIYGHCSNSLYFPGYFVFDE